MMMHNKCDEENISSHFSPGFCLSLFFVFSFAYVAFFIVLLFLLSFFSLIECFKSVSLNRLGQIIYMRVLHLDLALPSRYPSD